MGSLTSICPKCGAENYVINTIYMRGDSGATVNCERCGQKFRAKLTEKDIEMLFTDEKNPTRPILEGDTDYILEGEFYPIQ